MSRALRLVLGLLLLGGAAAAATGGPEAALERGTAITEPLALRELDGGRFGLGRMLALTTPRGRPISTAELFASPSMVRIGDALDAELTRYVERHRARWPDEPIGIGEGYAFQLFDRALLHAPDSRFALAGIVNRMDRAYLAPESCGEVRLIYRLVRDSAEAEPPRRLPMTLNLVLKARGDAARGVDCAQIARLWLASAGLAETGAAFAERLLAGDGPLHLVGPQDLDRIETNLQIAHAPKSENHDFRTDYLLKTFRYDRASHRFEETTLENQIDRERILADEALRREFRTWLLEPRHLGEFDRGTVLIPEKFLARSALAPTPAGFEPSDLQPAFGLVAGESADPVFAASDIVGALKQAAERGITLQNIRSPAGFQRRLNDITCAGCHQTRGIGGLHFPGVDWTFDKPSNAVVAGSPHFFGDQPRRRDILTAFAKRRQPDFSRGFAARPQARGSAELAGTEYKDGWGAHCHARRAGGRDDDKSFRSWTCAEGLACQVVSASTGMGMCFVAGRSAANETSGGKR